ncbi:MAG: glycogen debranching enzyme N-terminal domain-containing protein [Verrucomicrobiae bacterium]|nr:glycogen debranching enzyme N-terminal domain-containing protein [Verrucomicrobiae bacterium]
MMRLHMKPVCGERLLRFAGDRVRFELLCEPAPPPPGWRALLRTNLGRAATLREEIVTAHFQPLPLAGASWRDIPMQPTPHGWQVELPVLETGYFQAKAYALDANLRQHWPEGPNVGVSVHPDDCRTGNIIYCAFVRLYGLTRNLARARNEALEERLREWDEQGYAVIPPSGKLRDLTRLLPHIFETLGCRVLQLLPINPTPTTYARFGRFGSPYACQDLTAIDPALVEFDRRTTALDQFQELVAGVHRHGGKLFLDLVINHTGWGATLLNEHPEWYRRESNGEFASPGAWGNIWRDLVELDQSYPALWDTLAEAFLTWCRRGVDGFRCDAGYKVPLPVWQHITARVRQEYPDTIFLLEGLGGSWEATELLLTEGGMQWAYSELFQNYSGREVAGYLDYALRQCERVGLYTHYSETHDNNRLAARGRAWSLLRNRLCALTSVAGGFGFTGGVEWLAEEKINVHQCAGLNWGAAENLVQELATLNRLLQQHPCFFDGARLQRLSEADSPILALHRTSAEGSDEVLVLANTDAEQTHSVHLSLPPTLAGKPLMDLLGQVPPTVFYRPDGRAVFTLEPAAVFCLSPHRHPLGLSGDEYRRLRAAAAWALRAMTRHVPLEAVGACDWAMLGTLVRRQPVEFLGCLHRLDPARTAVRLIAALQEAREGIYHPRVVVWQAMDAQRVTLVPGGHWLAVRDSAPFRAQLTLEGAPPPLNLISLETDQGHIAAFPPQNLDTAAVLRLERPGQQPSIITATLRYLPPEPPAIKYDIARLQRVASPLNQPVVLLTNGRGAMARMAVDLGSVKSKYDAVLAANLHPEVPVDRHVLVKRLRLWVNADGFITPLNASNLLGFHPGPPARWRFVAHAGDGRSLELELTVTLAEGQNTTWLQLTRPRRPPAMGRPLPRECHVSITARFDIEDRNFHWETKHTPGAEHHFTAHHRPLKHPAGFVFEPEPQRRLCVVTSRGLYHPQGEWSHHLPHWVEQTRGMEGHGDAYSPGWFEIPLAAGQEAILACSTEPHFELQRLRFPGAGRSRRSPQTFAQTLRTAVTAFLARRHQGWTLIAGYPWFLDWSRDALIGARGLLAGGWRQEAASMLAELARWEERGTLPNAFNGGDGSNRDTSDAPLWLALVCEEMAAGRPSNGRGKRPSANFYEQKVADGRRTFLEVLVSVAENYLAGTPNGIHVDATSALVWSPAHFTWMDTNHPAATPREGYPIEIQVLWLRLLRQLERLGCTRPGESYGSLANRVQHALESWYWQEDLGWWADTLLAPAGRPARQAVPDRSLRPNALLGITLDVFSDARARRYVQAVQQHLLVPGGVRTLAPLPAQPPLPVRAADGRLLNDPEHPYWGHYEGDEDTRRKPAYHNGTAWVWLLPVYAEALVKAYAMEAGAVTAARACLASLGDQLTSGCLGHLPEILDGDAPHQERGCDAQAWSATEALRVWLWLEELNPPARSRNRGSGKQRA